MNTEDVYLARVVRKGLCIYRWYDITDYEYRRLWCEPSDNVQSPEKSDDSGKPTNTGVEHKASDQTNRRREQLQDRHHLSPLQALMMLDAKHLRHYNLHRVNYSKSQFITNRIQLVII